MKRKKKMQGTLRNALVLGLTLLASIHTNATTTPPNAVITVTDATGNIIPVNLETGEDAKADNINVTLSLHGNTAFVTPSSDKGINIASVQTHCKNNELKQYAISYGNPEDAWFMKSTAQRCVLQAGVAQCHFTAPSFC